MPKTLAQINEEIAVAAQDCKREFRRDVKGGLVISRGRFLSVTVADEHSNTKNPIEGEVWRWDGTFIDIRRAITASVKDSGLKPVEVLIYGGYNHAQSLRAHQDGDYDPLVAEWEVIIPISEIPNA